MCSSWTSAPTLPLQFCAETEAVGLYPSHSSLTLLLGMEAELKSPFPLSASSEVLLSHALGRWGWAQFAFSLFLLANWF